MNLQEWAEKYKPFREEDGEIFGFETYGKYQDYIYEQDIHHVWTLIAVDGHMEIVAGRRFIDRMNYFVTEEKWELGYERVDLDEEDEDELEIYFSI